MRNVARAEYDAGFDAELHKWVAAWVQKDWPFRKVAYPGRSISPLSILTARLKQESRTFRK